MPLLPSTLADWLARCEQLHPKEIDLGLHRVELVRDRLDLRFHTPLIAVAAQEKRTGWGEGYGPDKRNGEWEYAAFTPDLQRREVNLSGCFSCHLPRAAQDYTFSTWEYAATRR